MEETIGQQAEQTERSRASLLFSATEVMAEMGLSATIEVLAVHARVSPATIYNHFGSREDYLKEALSQTWRQWVTRFYNGRREGESFLTMVDVCRKLFRVNRDMSTLGRVLRQALRDSPFVIEAIKPTSELAFKDMMRKSGLEHDAFELRMDMWSTCIAGIFHDIFVTSKLSPEQADKALAIALAIWDIPADQAVKLTSRPLTY
jgi:AcrR family transcriptional regulator